MYQNKCLKYIKETSQLYQINEYYISNRCGPNRCLKCIKEMSHIYRSIEHISSVSRNVSYVSNACPSHSPNRCPKCKHGPKLSTVNQVLHGRYSATSLAPRIH